MMPPPGLQIKLRLSVTFDLLTPEVDRFMPLHCGPVVPFCIEIAIKVASVFRFKNIAFTRLVTD